MTKFKRWLYNQYLPQWCKENLMEENLKLQTQLAAANAENIKLQAYISGLKDAMRLGRKVNVYTGGEMTK